MALHDYACPSCGQSRIDYYVPITQRAMTAAPLCLVCQTPTNWIPQVGRIDAGSGAGFLAFDTQVLQPDGSHASVHINSLADLRRVERETEQRQRNGEGQAMIWRDYSNDRSNRDVHTMGKDPATLAQEALDAQPKRARLSVTRHGSTPPILALGAGVSEPTMSALEGL